VGKEGILGCGYGMGKDKFADRLRVQGIEVARDVSDSVVDTYRAEYHEIPELWASMNAAAIAAVESPGRITEGAPRGRIWFKCFEMHGVRWLVMRLPSGRRIFYHEPRLEPGQYGPEITYGRVDQRTRRWGRAKTYGGKLVENAVQAIARDIMADAILHMRGSDVFYLLSVHDEIIAESESTDALWWLQATMRKAPPWAAGFPIEVEGWSGPRYRK
jgi:DNA polymerase